MTHGGSVSTLKCDDLFALKHLCMGPLHHTIISLVQFQHSSLMALSALKTFMHGSPSPHHYILGSVQTFRHNHLSALGTFMCTLPHMKKCQIIHQNRRTHSGKTPIQLLRQIYESPINQDILMVALDYVKFKILSLTLWLCHKVENTDN